jgi:hypothetical protein
MKAWTIDKNIKKLTHILQLKIQNGTATLEKNFFKQFNLGVNLKGLRAT